MAIKITGNTGGIVETSDNYLHVNTPIDETKAGYVSIVAESDPGTIVDKTVRQLDASIDYRLRVGVDNIFWDDIFNYTTLNTSVYQGVTSTMTIALSGGSLNLNAGNAVASGNVARVQSYKTFPTIGTFPTYIDYWFKISAAAPANGIAELGIGYATTTTTPTDGVYFKIDNGLLKGVINYNGTETSVTLLNTIAVNSVYHGLIVVSNDVVEFWLDVNSIPTKFGEIQRTAANGSPTMNTFLPLLMRQYNSGVASSAFQVQVSKITVTLGDAQNGRNWAATISGMGLAALGNPPGASIGQLANYANSANPTSASLSNTAAGYTTLGGQFQFAAVAGAETDYALFAYQVPTGSTTQPARNLFITGITIFTYNMGAAVATTPTLLQWGLGLGSTAVSLATTDSATAGTRAPKRITLGAQSLAVSTAVGGAADKEIDMQFATPLMVEAGTFCHVILKMPVGTATASQVIRGTVMINGYFE